MANERQTVTSLSARSENVARPASLQAEQSQRTERAEAAAARLSGELEEAKQRLVERTRELRVAERRLAEARRAGLSDKLLLRALLGAGNESFAELQARCDTLERELAGIAASTSWKVTAPARWVGMKYPALARAMRRSLKLAWWSVRFELISRLRSTLRRRSRA
jgi:DNA-binding phage protein